MKQENIYKEEEPQKIKEVKMGIFGRGNGFLGLLKRYNWIMDILSTILAILGIAYFVRIGSAITSLGVLGLWIIIMIETHRH